jgi:HTH-type transcriptional regulator / antitoxin HigA
MTVRAADPYTRLCVDFPPRRIRNDRQCAHVEAVIHRLLDKPRLTRAEEDYLDTLSALVEAYENENHPIDASAVRPHEMLRYLMEVNNLKQEDLVPVLGSKAAVSLAVNGKRELSKPQIQALTRRFRISPAAFF